MQISKAVRPGVLAQVVVFAAAGWFLLETVRSHWGTVSRADLLPSPLPILVASVLSASTYVFLVLSWADILPWWGARLPRHAALRMFCLSNLARFVPGVVWQMAGLIAMARARGISAVAATSSVLLQQLLTLATGALLSAVTVGVLPGGAFGTIPTWLVIAGSVTLVSLVAALPLASSIVQRVATRVVGQDIAWPHPPVLGVVAFSGRLMIGWVGYAAAFGLFCRSLLGPQSPDLLLAGSAFIASYVAGLVAIFAPGGIVVREAALVGLLGPSVGGENALLLAVGSRIWLTALEVIVALGVVGSWPRTVPDA